MPWNWVKRMDQRDEEEERAEEKRGANMRAPGGHNLRIKILVVEFGYPAEIK